ncbi:hypothetical protein MVEN_00139900 [Mycena venus]|uniref:Uncharacterized protein n=1 Tax=Mycena venus TaxID=2733690 RepID=A0A8H7DDK8_9AGAR|nr:hypothetical protein MVEN_00139900 [Mycena venus]
MHCLLEGLVHYHCREVLQLNLADAAKTVKSVPAYHYLFASLDTDVPDKCQLKKPVHENDVSGIYKLLVHQLCDDATSEDGDSGMSDDDDDDSDKAKAKASDDDDTDDSLTPETLLQKLAKKHKPALVFVCWTLQLPTVVPAVVPKVPRKKKGPRKDTKSSNKKSAQETSEPLAREEYLVRLTKVQLADLLVEWRLKKPLRDETRSVQSKAINKESLRFVQEVIAKTVKPAWVNHVPKNYGEKGAGSIKADEWRLLATIYLPIALVILWGEQAKHAELLKQSMALFQAITIVCRFGMRGDRASRFRNFIKEWVDKLYSCHPHVAIHKKRTIVHMAFHIYDFLLLFGPIVGWWCFPIERLIGVLQKINSNNHVGGEHEKTVVTTWMRSVNLRRWINRKDCPELLRQFHRLYSMFIANKKGSRKDPELNIGSNSKERAYYEYEGMQFSRASTHLGNSLVSFLDPNGVAVFGSIEKIEMINPDKVQFVIRPQEPLPHNTNDPFKPFSAFSCSHLLVEDVRHHNHC